MGIQTFDGRCAVLVDPREIRVGDWMRDVGRLRQVESVEASAAPISPGVLVRFSDGETGPYATLSVPDGVAVTVWRMLAEAAGAGRL
jgi:hypothetical protein